MLFGSDAVKHFTADKHLNIRKLPVCFLGMARKSIFWEEILNEANILFRNRHVFTQGINSDYNFIYFEETK